MNKSCFVEYHTPNAGLLMEVKRRVHKERSKYQDIEVIDTFEFGRVLLLDGKVMLTERDEYIYHEMLIHPAMVTHPAPKNLAVIGGGDGFAIREVLKYNVNKVSLVEIDERVIAVSKEFFNCSWLDNDRVKIYYEDGTEWIKRQEKIDIIFVDSTDPEGCALPLFETNFLRDCKKSLTPEGIFVTQSESPFYHRKFIKKNLKNIGSIYKIARPYLAPIPTYPGGIWCFVFASEKSQPTSIKRNSSYPTRFYTPKLHTASFVLPKELEDFLYK